MPSFGIAPPACAAPPRRGIASGVGCSLTHQVSKLRFLLVGGIAVERVNCQGVLRLRQYFWAVQEIRGLVQPFALGFEGKLIGVQVGLGVIGLAFVVVAVYQPKEAIETRALRRASRS